MKSLRDRIFEANKDTFDALCMEIFAIQSKRCKPYKEYIEALEIDPSTVKSVDQIPFMPVSLFKSHNIILDQLSPQITFTSSSTTGMVPAKHPVADISVYQDSFTKGFEQFYGSPKEYAILALLPSYLEREGSSLIYMTESLIKAGKHPKSGFYLYNHDDLHKRLSELSEQNCPTILIGVSFALVDYASAHKTHFPKLIVIETGGMKGRGRELSRDEIHQTIKECFGVTQVHSEYGMAELLSQAYSKGDGLFCTPPWMKVVIRDLRNPFKRAKEGASGGVNIIDLANINSCSFIETQDMGIKEAGELFRISGRISNSELRGCNLLLDSVD